MYSNKLAFAVKVNGNILREFDRDKVYIPFGSEYSILIKNLNSVKALTHITIDGKSIDDNGGGFIVDANSEIDIERFVKRNDKGNRFKFIERTNKIEKHRGIKLDDGIIRVEFQFENPQLWSSYETIFHNNSVPTWTRKPCPFYKNYTTPLVSKWQSPLRDYVEGSDKIYGNSLNVNQLGTVTSTVSSAFVNDAGITVPGSESKQQFTTGHIGILEPNKHSMVIHLLGETLKDRPVLKPITVKAKSICVTCSHQNKVSSKFCSDCGTALEIIC